MIPQSAQYRSIITVDSITTSRRTNLLRRRCTDILGVVALGCRVLVEGSGLAMI